MSAYLKGEEAKIMTSSQVSSMSKASSIQDVLEIIRDTDIGNYLEGVLIKTFDELDEYLWRYLDDCLRRLELFKPLPADIVKILKTYIVKYDVLNIKAAWQGISTGRKAIMIPVGVMHNQGLLDELSRAGDVDGMVKLLVRGRLEGYASVLEEYKMDEGVKSRLRAEARLDGEYYKNLLNVTKDTIDGAILSRSFATIVDMTNLRIILRAIIGGIALEAVEYTISGGYMISEAVAKDLISLKLTDIPDRLENTQYHNVVEEVITNYDRSKSITAVEEIMEKHKFRLSQEILSPRVLSPLVIVWYLILKEVEIRNLRLILKAMFDNIPVEEIRNYLVLAS
jgi:V/A-type H+-transporting ATPase subunit C